MATGEPVGEIKWQLAMIAHEIDGTMFEHGKVLALNHSFNEWFGRIVCCMVFTLVAYSSGTLYLFIDAGFSCDLFPNLKLGFLDFHFLMDLIVLRAKVH